MEQYPHADDAEGHDERDRALVTAMYRGKKALLRPLHDAALAAARKLGKDVTPSARKTYVSLVRKRQFGAIQPSTTDRVDLGLVRPGVKARGRLTTATPEGTPTGFPSYPVLGVILLAHTPPPPRR